VYEPLSNWIKSKLNLEWFKITHTFDCIIYNDVGEKAEVDICLGTHKKNTLELTDVIHVKTKDNIQGQKDRYELLGKAKLTLNGASKVWIAIEKSTLRILSDGLDDNIGIITYEEKGDRAVGFSIKKEAKENTFAKFAKDTQELINKNFGKIIETTQSFFICSMNKDNWEICKRHKVWGVPEKSGAAESAIKRIKSGDILLFRLFGGIDYFAVWMATSECFEDKSGGPWKLENKEEKRDFVWQVKMHPLLVDDFVKNVKLSYEKGIDIETGIVTKSYMSGMVEITETQFKIIFKKLIDANKKQLS